MEKLLILPDNAGESIQDLKKHKKNREIFLISYNFYIYTENFQADNLLENLIFG